MTDSASMQSRVLMHKADREILEGLRKKGDKVDAAYEYVCLLLQEAQSCQEYNDKAGPTKKGEGTPGGLTSFTYQGGKVTGGSVTARAVGGAAMDHTPCNYGDVRISGLRTIQDIAVDTKFLSSSFPPNLRLPER